MSDKCIRSRRKKDVFTYSENIFFFDMFSNELGLNVHYPLHYTVFNKTKNKKNKHYFYGYIIYINTK